MGAIADRAGVSKQTIYNWWPSRGAVAFEGFMVRADPSGEVPPDATAAEALEILVVELVRLFTTTPAGPLMRGLVADAQSQPDVAELLRREWLAPRRAVVAELLAAGAERGELRADLDVEIAIDQAFAFVYYRLLLGHEEVTEDVARRAVRQLVAGITGPG
jgi:AcrR family transcriptional regulator